MYRLLLVDDENLELETLKNYVDWESMGIGEVLTAKNGKQAWECVLTEEPDVVITDIQMPVMNGIELAKKIREFNWRIKIIFLTGYDEVDYLKEAIRVSAIDYILKPFSDEAIEEAMKKVRTEMEKESLMQSSIKEGEAVLIRRICMGNGSSEELLEWQSQLLRLRTMDHNRDRYGVIMVFGVDKALALPVKQNILGVLSSWQENSRLTIVTNAGMNTADMSKRILDFLEKTTEVRYNSACYVDPVSSSELFFARNIVKSYEARQFYAEPGSVKIALTTDADWEKDKQERIEDEVLEEIIKKLTEGITNGESELVKDGAEQLFQAFLEIRASKDRMLRRISKISYQIERQCGVEKNKEDLRGDLEHMLKQAELAESAARVKTEMLNVLCALSAKNAVSESDNNDYVVRKVKDYIHKNYGSQITTSELADEIHLTPNYIRTIFKEGTGQTILEYLTNYRFEKACEMFRTTSLKVKEISVMVGYENVPYFCTLFTRIYGLTPNQYRKKYQ